MKQVVLNIDEARYSLFMQFLKTLDYVEVVQAPRRPIKKQKSPHPNGKHFLTDLAGSLSGPVGDELAEIVSREFQKIEGEW